MRRFLDITRYPVLVIFTLAGVSIVIVAYTSFNLLHLSMQNFRYIGENGWLALQSGALIQLLQIIAYGVVSLFFFMVFKLCEAEMVLRYRRWIGR
ncbi:hypothetical protein N4R57_20525 [Rhodobacteraceae bacterium D3-12]|nr:hypothetical protein N4R57_20525 [Rhodobacteraceae bacterium D3-12]